MLSDEVLMLQFQTGSRESFNELFARYRDPLYAFFRRRLSSGDRADDLSQELWLAVLRGAERYQPRALFRTYLYAIALKLLAAERRRDGKRKLGNVIAEPVVMPVEPATWVRDMLERLDADDREILMLREYEQLSYAEIGDVLRIPINTVRSKLFRARLTLKRLLEPGSGVAATGGKQ